MKHYLYLVLFLLPASILSQSAPDFTVTDIHGQEHTLYSQYLAQGKTVMLKIFYSTCPPCNAQADALQALYVEWGMGAHDVQFIEVSNKTWETNQTASGYASSHGITFPTVSATGGSIAVVNAYVNGGFGGFSGTPTYIVISPDGTVNWDVELVDLDAALTITGAVKPGTSSVNDLNHTSDLWIAPNPSADFLNVYTKVRPAGEISVSVYNMLGNRLHSFKPSVQDQALLVHEDASGWYSGTYLVRIQNNGTVLKTMRFVKK
ncbi:MAG TPA: redoxin domain-containing protein [Saprospiraceae bacterium]|nr:redoxin domain-containing protein [Saprospiraceae bacterium]